jgi:rare lipoprotein A
MAGARVVGDPGSPQAPIAHTVGAYKGATPAPAALVDNGFVPGMTGVSPADALPPLGGAGTGTGPKMPAQAPVAGPAPAQRPMPATASAAGKPTIYLQVGAFSDVVNANRVADQLNRAGLGPVSVIEASIGGRSVRRVRVGTLADVDTAARVTDQIAGMGLPRPSVAVD